MRIRVGFVSNSSSSSFCAYGLRIDNFAEYNDEGKLLQDLHKLLEGTCLDYMTGEDDELYVGRAPSTIGDNETGKEFKQKAKQDILKCFPDVKPKDINWICETVYG